MGTRGRNNSPKPISTAQQNQMEANAPASHKNGDFFCRILFYFKKTENKEKHPLSTNGKRRPYDSYH